MITEEISKIVADFKKTNLYTKEFLRDLERGLMRLHDALIFRKF